MTTVNASSAPPGRCCDVALQRGFLRNARSPRFRFAGNSAPAAISRFFRFFRFLRKARRAAALSLLAGFGSLTSACAEIPTPVVHSLGDATNAANSPRTACLIAAREAELAHGLPKGLLAAIALNESGLHAYALNLGGRAYYPATREQARRLLHNARGRGMVGCFQINAGVHVARGEDWPLDPSQAADWSARYLLQHYRTYGDWGRVILRWHGASPRSSASKIICRVRSKLEVTDPTSSLLTERCRPGAPQWARQRQNGAAHLEVAEAAE